MVSPAAGATGMSEWFLVPASSAVLETTAAVEASDIGLGLRGPAGNIFAISGYAAQATVTRFEVKRVLTFQTNGDVTGTPFFDHKVEPRQVEDAFFRLQFGNSESSIVVMSDRLEFQTPNSPLQLSHLEKKPVLLGFPNKALRDEYAAIRLESPRIEISNNWIEGSTSGSLRFYWFNASTDLVHSSTGETLHSTVRSEQITPTAVLVTSTWFELTAPQGRTDLVANGRGTEAVQLFARELALRDVHVIAVDRPVVVEGPTIEPTAGSLWLEGFFETTISEYRRSDSPSFRINAVGTLRQFSTGGGAISQPDWPIVATSGILFLALIGILVARALAGGALIPLYTKLRKDKLLNITSRDDIYRVIQQTPGIHFLELQKQVGSTANQKSPIGFGALAYHLSQMERFELIVSKREGRFRRYFDVSAKLGADASRVALLQTSPVNLVARVVLASPGANQGDLHARVGHHYQMTRQALSYHLRRLAEKDLVEIVMRGRFCHYRATERLHQLSSYIAGSQAAPGSEVVAAA